MSVTCRSELNLDQAIALHAPLNGVVAAAPLKITLRPCPETQGSVLRQSRPEPWAPVSPAEPCEPVIPVEPRAPVIPAEPGGPSGLRAGET
jgi:hypothetical protein